MQNKGCINDGKGSIYITSDSGKVVAKLTKKENKRRYYTFDNKSGKWIQVKNAYKTINNVLYYFRAEDGIATKMYTYNEKKLYRFVNSRMTLVKNDISKVKGNALYLFGSNGKMITKSGWYTLPSGTLVHVNTKGYVSAKLTKSVNARKYYTYSYKTNKWIQNKNVWHTVGGICYYFSSNGTVGFAYNTKTKKISKYSNGKFGAYKNHVVKLSNGKLYYFDSNSKKISKSGWYNTSSMEKIKVGSKGYVTMKLSLKSGKLYKYSYSNGRWIPLKVSTYKVGENTYYFDSKGIMVKNRITGDSKNGYFYVDGTGCRVESKEIQMAVNFVMANTTLFMTKQQKLRTCFMKIRTFPYQRDHMVPQTGKELSNQAVLAFKSGNANCYKYASAFACVATVLGYDARVTCGKMPAYIGYGLVNHGWTELWDSTSRSWKLYDACLQRAVFYDMDFADYFPGNNAVDRRARLVAKNGKAAWKWEN